MKRRLVEPGAAGTNQTRLSLPCMSRLNHSGTNRRPAGVSGAEWNHGKAAQRSHKLSASHSGYISRNRGCLQISVLWPFQFSIQWSSVKSGAPCRSPRHPLLARGQWELPPRQPSPSFITTSPRLGSRSCGAHKYDSMGSIAKAHDARVCINEVHRSRGPEEKEKLINRLFNAMFRAMHAMKRPQL